MSTYHLLRRLCGLSHQEAADYLGARLDSAKSWDSGRRSAPPGAIADLRTLAGRIRRAAEAALDQIDAATLTEGSPPDQVTLGRCTDDHEARSLGWPCRSAHDMVLARIVAAAPEGVSVRVVYRGSEPATAAAADWQRSLDEQDTE